MSLSDAQKATIYKAIKAVAFADNGDLAKDAIDDDEVVNALRLLVRIISEKEYLLSRIEYLKGIIDRLEADPCRTCGEPRKHKIPPDSTDDPGQ